MSCTTNRKRKGLSIIEALISLSLTAMLLVAVAAAYHASAAAIEMNDQFVRGSQAARISVNQIIGQIRACSSIVVGAHDVTVTSDTGDVREYNVSGTDLNLTYTPSG